MLRVLVLASSPDVREAVAGLLSSPGIDVATTAASVDELEHDTFDVLVADGEAWLADLDHVEGERELAVVVLAEDTTGATFARMRRAHLAGWAVVPPDADGEHLRAAVVAAAAGFAAVPADSGHMAGTPDVSYANEDEDELIAEPVTEREREVLALLGRGLSNRAIGERLGISEHTAKFHVSSLLQKLGAANRADAVRRGLRRGLIAM